MLVNIRHRSEETEIMDDFNLHGTELEQALISIARINQLLGGNKLTINAVDEIVSLKGKDKRIKILDLGCGNGDMLRALSKLAAKKNYNFSMTGIDANAFTVQNAENLSAGYPEISYTCADLLDPDFAPEECDIILFTLTLHHFTDEQILTLLEKSTQSARLAIVVNDLERSRLSYMLFCLISKVFRLNRMNTIDGKLSILRGFKKKELKALARKMNFKNYTIRWRWAFRYQWIISDL
jgi:2-polyprenyl-3-methyl-5-hydroxy-6-metoxy-1,4-benzoquinol methylase